MTTISILSVAGALCGLLGIATAIFALQAVQRWQSRCLSVEASVEAMRRELEIMASISAKTGRRVNRIENEYSGVADRVEVVELRGAAQSFDEAIDHAKRGVDPGKLTEQFGLSRGEADLVARLHGRQKSA